MTKLTNSYSTKLQLLHLLAGEGAAAVRHAVEAVEAVALVDAEAEDVAAAAAGEIRNSCQNTT